MILSEEKGYALKRIIDQSVSLSKGDSSRDKLLYLAKLLFSELKPDDLFNIDDPELYGATLHLLPAISELEKRAFHVLAYNPVLEKNGFGAGNTFVEIVVPKLPTANFLVRNCLKQIDLEPTFFASTVLETQEKEVKSKQKFRLAKLDSPLDSIFTVFLIAFNRLPRSKDLRLLETEIAKPLIELRNAESWNENIMLSVQSERENRDEDVNEVFSFINCRIQAIEQTMDSIEGSMNLIETKLGKL